MKEQPLVDDITRPFNAGEAGGVIAGNAYIGNWKGQFFGRRHYKKLTEETRKADPDRNEIRQLTTTYTPGMPGSVAGAFFVTKESGEGEAAFIGAFGAHR